MGPKSVIKYLGVFIDHKFTRKNHIQYVEEKLCTARGILSKLRYYASISVLRSVYFGIAYPHLHYEITSWGNSASKLGWPLFFDFKIIMLSPPHFTLLYEKLRETNF